MQVKLLTALSGLDQKPLAGDGAVALWLRPPARGGWLQVGQSPQHSMGQVASACSKTLTLGAAGGQAAPISAHRRQLLRKSKLSVLQQFSVMVCLD